MEIVNRFEKQRTLTFAQLRDEIFGQHWHDETWHEVLRLTCGAIDPKFAGELIKFLMKKEIDRNKFEESPFHEQTIVLNKESLGHLFLAFDCLLEVKQTLLEVKLNLLRVFKNAVENSFHQASVDLNVYIFDDYTSKKITKIITELGGKENALPWLMEQVEKHNHSYFSSRTTFPKNGKSPTDRTVLRAFAVSALKRIADVWKQEETLFWLQHLSQQSKESIIRGAALQELAKGWRNHPETLSIIRNCLQKDEDEMVRRIALEELASYWEEYPETLSLIKEHARTDIGYARASAIVSLADKWKDDPESFLIIKLCTKCNQQQSDFYARAIAIQCLAQTWREHPETLNILIERSQNDRHEFVRNCAIDELLYFLKNLPELFDIFNTIVAQDTFKRRAGWGKNPRQAALKALLTCYPTHPKTIELLRDKATNDPDEQLREWAQEQLKMQNGKLKEEEA